MMIDHVKKSKIELQLTDGYKTRKNESLIVSEAFEPFDLEGWDDY